MWGDRQRRGRAAAACDALQQRVRMVVPATLRGWECDPGPYSPSSPPSRCVFQFSGQDGSNELFPIEYVLRLMSDWTDEPCDPYLRVQNTGVSVLFQGFFSRPSGGSDAPVAADRNNVILRSTETTGLALSDLDAIKRRGGLDTRPMMACMWVYCFARMPRVQLSFRFMGPEDADSTRRLLYRAAERAIAGRLRAPGDREPERGLRAEPRGAEAAASPWDRGPEPGARGSGGRRPWRRLVNLVCLPRPVPPWLLAAGAAGVWVAASGWLAYGGP
ncbi:nuclear egress membrane protein [Ateline alphaherpesvirus 1]|uniref:Nuclear egress membrane protein n=1 Tax=Herpesvirus ateles type 1 (strain Lennette) TaxID=35243 RepID=A0A1S6JLM9_HSVA1|nr:nuclear egress membrane protein [Ateline alphaherpesvirus 1]AQS79181.1 nuclear egress membrane protein [Ateline alphaherpesvirus 1]